MRFFRFKEEKEDYEYRQEKVSPCLKLTDNTIREPYTHKRSHVYPTFKAAKVVKPPTVRVNRNNRNRIKVRFESSRRHHFILFNFGHKIILLIFYPFIEFPPYL